MIGILIQNGDRPDIAFENGTTYGGLHCGECFQIYRKQWEAVRLEYDEGWILICQGRKTPVEYGSMVVI